MGQVNSGGACVMWRLPSRVGTGLARNHGSRAISGPQLRRLTFQSHGQCLTVQGEECKTVRGQAHPNAGGQLEADIFGHTESPPLPGRLQLVSIADSRVIDSHNFIRDMAIEYCVLIRYDVTARRSDAC